MKTTVRQSPLCLCLTAHAVAMRFENDLGMSATDEGDAGGMQLPHGGDADITALAEYQNVQNLASRFRSVACTRFSVP